MLELTALLTKDSIEPLALPGMRPVHLTMHSIRLRLIVPITGQLVAVRGMIHPYARPIVAYVLEKDSSALSFSRAAICCLAWRSKLTMLAASLSSTMTY